MELCASRISICEDLFEAFWKTSGRFEDRFLCVNGEEAGSHEPACFRNSADGLGIDKRLAGFLFTLQYRYLNAVSLPRGLFKTSQR
jgi:hypothetical protein